MERRRLGPTGACVGSLGLGTTTWGHGTDRGEAVEQVRLLLEAGGDLIDIGLDSVDAELAGAVLADASAPAHAFLSIRSAPAPSARDLLDELDRSLGALGVDHTDMWSIAGWDPRLPWDELVGALAVAVATGRARYVGSSPEHAWHAALCGAGLALHPQRSPLAAITSAWMAEHGLI